MPFLLHRHLPYWSLGRESGQREGYHYSFVKFGENWLVGSEVVRYE